MRERGGNTVKNIARAGVLGLVLGGNADAQTTKHDSAEHKERQVKIVVAEDTVELIHKFGDCVKFLPTFFLLPREEIDGDSDEGSSSDFFYDKKFKLHNYPANTTSVEISVIKDDKGAPTEFILVKFIGGNEKTSSKLTINLKATQNKLRQIDENQNRDVE